MSYSICCFPCKLKKPITIYPGELCQNFQQMLPLLNFLFYLPFCLILLNPRKIKDFSRHFQDCKIRSCKLRWEENFSNKYIALLKQYRNTFKNDGGQCCKTRYGFLIRKGIFFKRNRRQHLRYNKNLSLSLKSRRCNQICVRTK